MTAVDPEKIKVAYDRGYLMGAQRLEVSKTAGAGTIGEVVKRYRNKLEADAFRRGYIKGMLDHK